jgi:uncharacterized protein (DUF2267 family)
MDSYVKEDALMQMNEFMGQVQNSAKLASIDQAIKATRATLETLAERLGPDEARHLGAQLPEEIGQYLYGAMPGGERFDSDEFLKRVSKREGVDLPVSVFHARAVLEALQNAVSVGEISDVLERLPDDYARLFAGTEGRMRGA